MFNKKLKERVEKLEQQFNLQAKTIMDLQIAFQNNSEKPTLANKKDSYLKEYQKPKTPTTEQIQQKLETFQIKKKEEKEIANMLGKKYLSDEQMHELASKLAGAEKEEPINLRSGSKRQMIFAMMDVGEKAMIKTDNPQKEYAYMQTAKTRFKKQAPNRKFKIIKMESRIEIKRIK